MLCNNFYFKKIIMSELLKWALPTTHKTRPFVSQEHLLAHSNDRGAGFASENNTGYARENNAGYARARRPGVAISK
jgi:hypothetical protein